MLNEQMVRQAIGAAMGNEHLPPPALAALRERKWRELARFAAGHSPFYGRLYRGLDLDRVPLEELPTVTKDVIQEHFDAVVTEPGLTLNEVKAFSQRPDGEGGPWLRGRFAVLMSSGTSGRRGYFLWDGPALADAIAQGFRQSNRPGAAPAGPQRIAAVMLPARYDSAGTLIRLIPESVGAKRIVNIEDPVENICRQLDEFQPTLLSAFPYMLCLLAERALDGRLSIKPIRITSSGDVLTASDRALVRRAFGVEVHNYYCSTEVPYVAWECDAHNGLHVNADYLIAESVDPANRPVPAGQLGSKLLLTNLSCRVLPLLRYEMADQVEYADGPCGCGCALPRVRTVAGRVEHFLSLPCSAGGRVALIPENIDAFVGGLPGLANYQVIQTGPADLTVNVIGFPDADGAALYRSVGDALAACWQRYGVAGGALQVGLRHVEELEPARPGGTKVCHYWNRWQGG